MSDYGTGDPYGTGWKFTIPAADIKFDFSPIAVGPSTQEMLNAILKGYGGELILQRTDSSDRLYVRYLTRLFLERDWEGKERYAIDFVSDYDDLDEAIESIYGALVALGHITVPEKA